jgi:twitching motility protein PilT
MKIEFIESGRTVEAEAIRFTEAEVDGKKMICIGCRFLTELPSDTVGAITCQMPEDPSEPAPGEPVRSHRVIVRAPARRAGSGLPLLPHGEAMDAHDLLRLMVDRGASDLHLKGGSIARIRDEGSLTALSRRTVTPDEALQYLRELLTDAEFARFESEWDLDFGYSADGIGRFRINVLRSRGEVGMAIRRIPDIVPTIDELGLAPVCKKIADSRHGLVLVTGPTGSGKSTTLAAMVRHINESRACHVVTLEDPIEYVHTEDLAQITQREIGSDVKQFAGALSRAMRQDPDVILVGEMRDLETISLAVTAAETGHLVFGTLHTTAATSTVERIVDVFPAHQQAQIRAQLANSLHAICSQVLVPKKDAGLVVAQEVIVATHGVRALIRDGKQQQMANAMQTGAREGMQTLEDGLNNLVARGIIQHRTAVARANQPGLILPRR